MIRLIQRNEIEKCVEVIRKSFLTVAWEYGFTEDNAPRFTSFATNSGRLYRQFDEGRPMYAYFDESGYILGYYSLHIQEERECELNNLCVLPEYRHRKIGEILFFHSLMTAADCGCIKVNIGIVEENDRLRAWYEKLGARHVGTKKFDFFPFTCGYMEKTVYAKELLLDLHDYSVGGTVYKRTAARGIIRKNDKYLVIYGKYGDYKFPGGGMEAGERLYDTLIREVKEETGYSVIPESIRQCILVHEKRKGFPDDLLEMDSWYFFCNVSEEKGTRNLDEYEKEYDYQTEWLILEEIIAKNKSVTNYENIPWIVRETMVMQEVFHMNGKMEQKNIIALREPTEEYAQDIFKFYKEIAEANDKDSFAGCSGLHKADTMEKIKAWIEAVKINSKEENCPKGKVPSDVYIAVRLSDNKIVGITDFRHHINHPVLSLWGGHIGYTVRPCERGNGYGKEMLRQNLLNCKRHGIERVMITCSADNPASEKIILANGGIFDKTVEVDGELIKRYWIEVLSKAPEVWDAYYPDGTLAGVDLVRGQRIPEKYRHAVSEVFVIHEDGSILIMQRDFSKPNYPGFWESGAGGSVLKGEAFEEAAKRELHEETGIIAEKLTENYKAVTHDTIYKGYVCITGAPKNSVVLQEGETINYKWVDKEEFLRIFESEQFPSTLRERLRDFVKNLVWNNKSSYRQN